jgi:hypothetical protein
MYNEGFICAENVTHGERNMQGRCLAFIGAGKAPARNREQVGGERPPHPFDIRTLSIITHKLFYNHHFYFSLTSFYILVTI